jgi:hypothetical protein
VPASERAVELGLAAAQAAADKLASDILLLDVSEQLVITDVFLLASAPSDRQVKAVVDEVEDALRELGAKPVRREGAQEAAGCCSTSSTSSCTSSTRRSGSSTPSSGCGRTARHPVHRPRRRAGRRPEDLLSRRIVLLRHGRTSDNAAGRIQGSGHRAGRPRRAQAEAVAAALAALRRSVLLTSDLSRAVDTALPVARATASSRCSTPGCASWTWEPGRA